MVATVRTRCARGATTPSWCEVECANAPPPPVCQTPPRPPHPPRPPVPASSAAPHTARQELEACTTFEEVLAEAQTAVTFIAAWFGNADGYVGEGSPAYCLLLRLHALPVTRPQLDLLLQSPNVYCRCLGLLYLRYTRFRDPGLYYRFEKAFRDTTRVTLDHRGTEFTTVGELALNLLKKLRFLGTMLPRVPVEAANRLETLLGVSLEDAAPLQVTLGGLRKSGLDVRGGGNGSLSRAP